MKKFNKIYKLLLVLPLIFMVSCDDSDDIVEVLTQTTTTTQNSVFIETDATSEADDVTVVGPNEATSINVGVNNTLDTDTTVSFSVTKDGGTAIEGTDYTISDATISSDEMTGAGSITFFTEGTFEVVVSSSSNSSLVVVQNKAIFLVPAPTPVTVTLTWADAFDLDIEFDVMTETWGWAGITLDGSYGFSNTETMSASLIHGNFAIWIIEWGGPADVDYTIEVETVNGTETFTGTVSGTGWNLWFTLDRDSEGNPIFTFIEENPS